MRDQSIFYGLIILVCLIWSCKTNTGAAWETDFKISNPERITTIEIYHRGNLSYRLSKTNHGWIVNQKYTVRQDAIENILRILPGLQVMYYPPKASWENMVKAIHEQGVKLVFKNAAGQKMKTFSLGGTTNDERGTYAMIDGSAQPFVIHVPGFDGSLANRFIMEENEWRDRMIFKEKMKDLIRVKVMYPEHPGAGFELENKGGNWKLYTLSNTSLSANESLILSYLDAFSGIGAEGIENDYRYIPQVLETTPHAVIEMYALNGATRVVKFYPVLIEGQAAVERFYVYDGTDFYLAQMRILQKIFRSIDSF